MGKALGIVIAIGFVGLAGGGYFMYHRSEQARVRLEQLAREERAERDRAEAERHEAEKLERDRQAALILEQQQQLRVAEAKRQWDKIRQEGKILRINLERAFQSLATSFQELESGPSQSKFDKAMTEVSACEAVFSELKSLVVQAEAFRKSDEFKLVEDSKKLIEEVDSKDIAKFDLVGDALRTLRTAHRHDSIDVRADDGWQSSSLTVKLNETVLVQASGTWKWASFLQPDTTGPAGVDHDVNHRIEASIGNAALLSRVEGSANVFPGWSSFTSPRDGKLQFRINDRQLSDNSGSLHVEVWVLPYVDLTSLSSK